MGDVEKRRRCYTPEVAASWAALSQSPLQPLGPAELRHHVVLVDFWTFTCINWLPTEPYIRAWSQAYRDDGLVRGLRLVALTLRPR